MKSLTRLFICAIVGAAFAGIILLASAIFTPLLFPQSLSDAESAHNWISLFANMMFLPMVFGAAGFVICWKLTKRAVKG